MAPGPSVFSVVTEGRVLRLVGELDLAGVPEATTALVPAGGDLVVDCAALTFLDAAGLGVLVGAYASCEAAGVDLILVDLAPCMTRLLGLTGLDHHFFVRCAGARR
ncbi:MAG: STAS domain-containing protein [Acidimicrobiales bacterium]|nr:STAS domain-containing protein [Acidimicrobiales bacterium]